MFRKLTLVVYVERNIDSPTIGRRVNILGGFSQNEPVTLQSLLIQFCWLQVWTEPNSQGPQLHCYKQFHQHHAFSI